MSIREEIKSIINSFMKMSCDEYCDYVNQLGYTADKILSIIEKDKWISVEDRLPEPINGLGDYRSISGNVLCYCEEFGMIKAYYEHDEKTNLLGWHATDTDYESGEPWLRDKNVTHWMTLPEPPKGAQS